MTSSTLLPDVNPFSTRFVRPGAIAYLFPAGTSADELLDRFVRSGRRGAIVGPHGSGKSTLLSALREALERRGRPVVVFTLRAGQRSLPLDRSGLDCTGLDCTGLDCAGLDQTSVDSWDSTTDVLIDGYEQLGLWQRVRLHVACWRKGCGLLVTSHGPVQLPTLIVTEVTLALAMRIVAQIGGSRCPALPPEALAQLLARRRGNLREVLFDVYDLYRSQRS